MWATSLDMLTELPAGNFKEEQVQRLKNRHCGIDEARILKEDSLCVCNCGMYMHYVVCQHVLADCMLKGSITAYPPNFDPRNIGHQVGRPPKAIAGQPFGKQ